MASVTVIIPTIGKPEHKDAVYSALQSRDSKNDVTPWLILDKPELRIVMETGWKTFLNFDSMKLLVLPENTGANGYYGHRIYAACSYLVNSDYIMYLDEDNWYENGHVDSMVECLEETKSDWVYSLRNIYEGDNFICQDNCESLGKWSAFFNDQINHIDTSCFLVKTEVIRKIGHVWFHGWGGDRVFFHNLAHHFPNYSCTGKYTIGYRLDGNENSVKKDFFLEGNKIMNLKYKGNFPWQKNS